MYGLLSGMTVVEGAAFIAGPSCGLHLAQLGATVVRFDQIGGGPDRWRWPRAEDGTSFYWEGLNKAKQSIAINLSEPAGRRLAQRIATAGDGLFVTSFPERGFLSYDALAKLRHDLICLRIKGWADGTPAVDYTINAAIGVPMMTGPADDPGPVNHVLPAWDLVAGAYGAFALLAAERDRARTGRGRDVQLALSDLAAATLAHLGSLAETISGGDRARHGNDLFGAFGRDFMTADGVRLMIVAITTRQWSGLVQSLDLGTPVSALEEELAVSFLDEGRRFVHRDRLFPIVAAAVQARCVADLADSFVSHGVCWSRYDTLAGAIANEARFFTDNPVFAETRHPGGTYLTPGSALRLPGEPRSASVAPSLGQHTDLVLETLLGMGAAEIGHLHDTGIVA